MSNPSIPDSQLPTETPAESFDAIFSQYEQSHSRSREDGGKQIEGTVIALSAESVFVDIGFKSEGILPLTAFQSAGQTVNPAISYLSQSKVVILTDTTSSPAPRLHSRKIGLRWSKPSPKNRPSSERSPVWSKAV
jgi:ribosomal protein S1